MTKSKHSVSGRRAGTGLIALALPLMMLSLATPVANATTVGSTVVAVDKCFWFTSGARDIIVGSTERYSGKPLALTNIDSSIVEEFQTGEALTLALNASKAQIPLAGLGNSSDCSFYNSVFGLRISVSVDDVPFSASYQKLEGEDLVEANIESLGFQLAGEAAKIEINLRDSMGSTTCDSGFTAGGGNLVAESTVMLLERARDGLQVNYGNQAAPFCRPLLVFTVNLPQVSMPPEGTGTKVTFSGPTLTFSGGPLS